MNIFTSRQQINSKYFSCQNFLYFLFNFKEKKKLKKVTLFSGYIIINNALYHDKEALSKNEELLQNTDILEVCSQLNGSFRFVIDTPTNTFFGIDHFGGYSLFYKNFPNFEIIINPNQKSQLSDIQDNQLCSLLASGFCYGDNTLFKNIKECTPGILYSYDKNQ